MKVLSLRQPWALFVVHFGKHIENRRWSTSHRGPFLIHAARGMTRLEFDSACEFAKRVGVELPHEVELREMLEFGGIVGRARLARVVPPCGGEGGRCACELAISFGRSWHMPDQHGFVLEGVERLPFAACKGLPGFFEAPAEAA